MSEGIRTISAVTLVTRDMARSVAFYRALGFRLRAGGETAEFTTFDAGASALNLIQWPAGKPEPAAGAWWGRVIFHVDDADTLHRRALAEGLHPESPPRNGDWGERYFHIVDPDGHELSFARPLG